MLLKTSTSAPRRDGVKHVRWISALATLILLAGLGLGLARSAAASGTAPIRPAALLPGPPLVEGEEECEADEPDCPEAPEAEECEAAEEEGEECEEAGEDEGEAPSECLLTRAQPRVTVAAAQNRLRLGLRYTLDGPAEVAIGLRSSGPRGAVSLPVEKRRLSHSGSLQISAALSPAETARALAASQFTVRLRVLGVPWSCHRYDFRHLSTRHGSHGGAVFSESRADLRAGR